jgi:hypothetical protein
MELRVDVHHLLIIAPPGHAMLTPPIAAPQFDRQLLVDPDRSGG